MASRSPEQIRTNLENSIHSKDPTIDITIGPVQDIVTQPIPEELSITEQEAVRLTRIHSTEFAVVATSSEVEALRTSMRLPVGTGGRSRGLALFYTNFIPPEGIVIFQGTLIGTRDGKYIFQTTEERIIDGSNSQVYYNTINFRYEVTIPIIAVASGKDYDLPQERINNVISTINGIDGVINPSATSGGTESETQEETVKRLQTRFLGFDSITGNGFITTYITNNFQAFLDDVAIIRPKDQLFKRPARRLAMDVYLSGTNPVTYTETYVLTSTDEENISNQGLIFKYTLKSQPVISITSVIMEGGNLPSAVVLVQGINILNYRLAKDNGLYFNSSLSQDQLWIRGEISGPNKLIEGTKITVTYMVESLIKDVQDSLFNPDTSLVDTDILVRGSWEGMIILELLAKVLTDPSDDRSQSIKDDLESTTVSYIENGKFGLTLDPEIVRQDIKSLASNVIDIFIKTFRRQSCSFRRIETVEMNKNEIPKIYQENGVPFSIQLVK